MTREGRKKRGSLNVTRGKDWNSSLYTETRMPLVSLLPWAKPPNTITNSSQNAPGLNQRTSEAQGRTQQQRTNFPGAFNGPHRRHQNLINTATCSEMPGINKLLRASAEALIDGTCISTQHPIIHRDLGGIL